MGSVARETAPFQCVESADPSQTSFRRLLAAYHQLQLISLNNIFSFFWKGACKGNHDRPKLFGFLRHMNAVVLWQLAVKILFATSDLDPHKMHFASLAEQINFVLGR